MIQPFIASDSFLGVLEGAVYPGEDQKLIHALAPILRHDKPDIHRNPRPARDLPLTMSSAGVESVHVFVGQLTFAQFP